MKKGSGRENTDANADAVAAGSEEAVVVRLGVRGRVRARAVPAAFCCSYVVAADGRSR